MPKPAYLQVALISDATFSRGEGTAGVVDTEVERDDLGLPFIGGRTLRGLLRDSWLSMSGHFPEALQKAATRMLGQSQALDESCQLRIGDAHSPETIRSAVRAALRREPHPLTQEAILEGFTSIRYQTAEDRATGAPERTTLRSSRVVLRGFVFEAALSWLNNYEPDANDLKVLGLCALATRHGGLLRNRGRGHIRIWIDGSEETTKSCAEATP
jgi:hypothetical protein